MSLVLFPLIFIFKGTVSFSAVSPCIHNDGALLKHFLE